MSMGKSNLQLCVDKLHDASVRLRTGPAIFREAETLDPVIEAVAHLAEYCRQRIADDPSLYPHQLGSSIMNLCGRIEALENPANPLYAREDGERDEWQHLLDTIGGDCRKHGWTDIDALIAWQMGLAAMLQARLHQARFHHDVVARS